MNFLFADSFTVRLARLTGDEQKAVKTTAFDLYFAKFSGRAGRKPISQGSGGRFQPLRREIPVTAWARHVGLPALAPAAIVALYFTPVETFGCVVRGLMAFGIALVAGIAAIVTALFAIRARFQRNEPGTWWLLPTLVLALPIVLLLGPLG